MGSTPKIKTYHGIEYQILRSDRRTVSVEVTRDGAVIARAPRSFPEREIERFIGEKEAAIVRQIEKMRRINETAQKLSEQELADLTEQARQVIPPKVASYAKQLGIPFGKVTIRHQKTRWGSCSETGNLNFNCLLMLAPPEVLDYVIIHELCHLKEMNHSDSFWNEVEGAMPDYRGPRQWLKKNGPALMARNP